MFIRFVVTIVHPYSNARLGVIHAAHYLRCTGELPEHDVERISEALDWFNGNLAVPRYYVERRHARAKGRALCWFKADAKASIERARDLQWILEYYGRPVEMIKSRRPGYIVYEDRDQITAIPFRDTSTSRWRRRRS